MHEDTGKACGKKAALKNWLGNTLVINIWEPPWWGWFTLVIRLKKYINRCNRYIWHLNFVTRTISFCFYYTIRRNRRWNSPTPGYAKVGRGWQRCPGWANSADTRPTGLYSTAGHHHITVFDVTLVKRLITKISVFVDHFTVDFKSGITIDIEA